MNVPPSKGKAVSWSAASRTDFAAGVRAGIGPASATFVLALTYGAAAITRGWGITVPVLFSVFAWSSSAQFTLLSTLAAGSAIPAVAAATLINVRYLVMSVALNDSMRGGRLRTALQAQALADASFAISHSGHGEYNVSKLIGASCPQWLCWVLGTATGLILAPSSTFIHTYGLDTTLPAFFLILAFEEMRRSRLASAAGVLGASITAAMLFVVEPGMALLAATAAASIGLLARNRPDADTPHAKQPQATAREGENS